MRVSFLFVILPSLAAAQAPSTQPTREITFGFSERGPRYGGEFIVNAPYSAKRVEERSQTLPDGTRVTRPASTVLIFRDAAGRTRAEWPISIGPNGPSSTVIVQIEDPGAGVEYIIDHQHRTTHRLAIERKTPAPTHSNTPPNVEHGRPRLTVEDAGTQTIEGLVTQGYRETRVDPAGLVGNDRPITTVRETWWSAELRMNIVVKNSSPVTGDTAIRFTRIVLGDPSAALFQPPPDYAVIAEPGPFVLSLAP